MEIPHSHLPKVTRMVFVEIRSVVVLSTGHTTSTRMLAMLANTSVAGGDVAAADEKVSLCAAPRVRVMAEGRLVTGSAYSLRVFVDRVGIVSIGLWIVVDVDVQKVLRVVKGTHFWRGRARARLCTRAKTLGLARSLASTSKYLVLIR